MIHIKNIHRVPRAIIWLRIPPALRATQPRWLETDVLRVHQWAQITHVLVVPHVRN